MNHNEDKLIINVYYEAIYEVKFITFWNFNGKELSKGVKEIEILIDLNVFRGKISKGVNNVKTNYSTTISLSSYNYVNDKYNFDIGGRIQI